MLGSPAQSVEQQLQCFTLINSTMFILLFLQEWLKSVDLQYIKLDKSHCKQNPSKLGATDQQTASTLSLSRLHGISTKCSNMILVKSLLLKQPVNSTHYMYQQSEMLIKSCVASDGVRLLRTLPLFLENMVIFAWMLVTG